MALKTIMMLIYPGCQALDVAGPVDAFTLTNEVCEDRGSGAFQYKVKLVAPQRGGIRTHGGVMRFDIDAAISEISDAELEKVDTFMIAGGSAAISLCTDPDVIEFIKRASDRAERIGSVCTSAFLFAQAGVLDGLKVTTHWRVAAMLAEHYPKVDVSPDKLVCKDGKVWSSGGISAGVDLALSLVENDMGADVARSVARMMVMFLARPGGQNQFRFPEMDPEYVPTKTDVQMQEIINLIRLYPKEDLRRSTIASRFNITERTLARRFQSFTGVTVAKFVEDVRLSHARMRLEDSTETLESVAIHAGFGSADSMRRIFSKRLSIGPQDYRARFKSAFHNTDISPISTEVMS